MTLIDAFKVPCKLVEKARVPDGEGGWTTEWADSDAFDAAITADASAGARLAEKATEQGTCTVTVDRDVELPFHSVLRRDSDGATFRIVGANAPTPGCATFQFNQYRAEEWELA